MKTKRIVWTVVFLSITLAAIVMEVVAGIFHPAGTIPWTEYLARYVPWPIQLAAYVALAVWLPFHFWRHDHLRKVAYIRGRNEALKQVQAFREAAPIRLDPPPGCPRCSHGYPFGYNPEQHLCGELPSDAVRYVPGRSSGR